MESLYEMRLAGISGFERRVDYARAGRKEVAGARHAQVGEILLIGSTSVSFEVGTEF